MADEVKLITFAGETVSPLYDGLMQELYTGGGGIITGAVVTIKDASNLHITGGYGALCGREFEIFASDIPVTLSSSGTLKGRLYLHMDLAQSGAPIELLVEVASSLTPVVQDSDVNTTNGVYEVNLATFDVGTSAISNLVDVSPKLSKIPDQISSLNSAISALNSKFVTESTSHNIAWTANTWVQGQFDLSTDWPVGYNFVCVSADLQNPWADILFAVATKSNDKIRVSYAAYSSRTITISVSFRVLFEKA